MISAIIRVRTTRRLSRVPGVQHALISFRRALDALAHSKLTRRSPLGLATERSHCRSILAKSRDRRDFPRLVSLYFVRHVSRRRRRGDEGEIPNRLLLPKRKNEVTCSILSSASAFAVFSVVVGFARVRSLLVRTPVAASCVTRMPSLLVFFFFFLSFVQRCCGDSASRR